MPYPFKLYQPERFQYWIIQRPKRYARQHRGRSPSEMQPFDRKHQESLGQQLCANVEERVPPPELLLVPVELPCTYDSAGSEVRIAKLQ